MKTDGPVHTVFALTCVQIPYDNRRIDPHTVRTYGSGYGLTSIQLNGTVFAATMCSLCRRSAALTVRRCVDGKALRRRGLLRGLPMAPEQLRSDACTHCLRDLAGGFPWSHYLAVFAKARSASSSTHIGEGPQIQGLSLANIYHGQGRSNCVADPPARHHKWSHSTTGVSFSHSMTHASTSLDKSDRVAVRAVLVRFSLLQG